MTRNRANRLNSPPNSLARRLLAPAVVLGVAIAGGTLLWSSLSTVEVAKPMASTLGEFRFEVGTRTVYSLTSRTSVSIGGGDQPASWQHDLDGRLQVEIVEGETGLLLAARLVGVDQRVDGESSPEPLLATPFSVEIGPDGRLGKFRFDRTLPEAPRGQIEKLLQLFEFVIPNGAGGSWQDKAATDYGLCTTIYRRQGKRISRSRTSYVARDGNDRVARVLGSKSSCELHTNGGWLHSGEIQEAIHVRGEMNHTVRAETTASLTALSGAPWSDQTSRIQDLPPAEGASTHSPTVMDQPIPATRPASPADRQRLHDLLAKLDQESRPGKLLDEIRDLLIAHPDLCAMVPDLLRGDTYADRTASTLIHAMCLAGHEEAQAGLAALSADPRQRQPIRIRSLIDLGGVRQPTSAAQEHLWAIADSGIDAESRELASTATLALGRLGYTMRNNAQSDYPQLRAGLQDRLRVAPDAGSRTALLAAAGNTRDPELQQSIIAHLDDDSPGQRGAAAKALGRIPSSQGHLLQQLAKEQNARVRRQLARGLLNQGQLGEAPLRLVARQLTKENDVDARHALAQLIGAQLEQFPKIGGPALQQLLRTEVNTRNRAYAAGRLAAAGMR